MADQAKIVEISRSRGGSTLQDSVCARLSVDPDDVTWDAYRTDEGRWIVTAALSGSSVGSWIYEVVGRTVHPNDESARALMGGGPSAVADPVVVAAPLEPEPDPTPVEAAPETPRPRLVSVTSDPTVDSPSTEAHSRDETAQVSAEQSALLEQSDVSSAPRRAKRAKGKKGRASVPSWDEILFGASRPED